MSAGVGLERPEVAATRRLADFAQLTKPRIALLVAFSTLVGYVCAAGGFVEPAVLLHALVGTALVAGSAGTFNQVLERNLDALMERTADRPLPAGRLKAGPATVFGLLMLAFGAVQLAVLVNPLASLLAVVTVASYILLYTPLKRVTWLSTLVGAVPGALPPVIGWAAARGSLDVGAWILFGIVFLWQMPHFLAIAALCRRDYERAGFKVLPVLEPDGASTGRQAALYALALLPVSLLPFAAGFAGYLYLAGAVLVSAALLASSVRFARAPTDMRRARDLFRFSLVHLPAVWLLLVVG